MNYTIFEISRTWAFQKWYWILLKVIFSLSKLQIKLGLKLVIIQFQNLQVTGMIYTLWQQFSHTICHYMRQIIPFLKNSRSAEFKNGITCCQGCFLV